LTLFVVAEIYTDRKLTVKVDHDIDWSYGVVCSDGQIPNKYNNNILQQHPAKCQ